jgi:hypothetical protein
MAEGEIKDLFPLIDFSSVECLNQDATHTVEHCFKQVGTATGRPGGPWLLCAMRRRTLLGGDTARVRRASGALRMRNVRMRSTVVLPATG